MNRDHEGFFEGNIKEREYRTESLILGRARSHLQIHLQERALASQAFPWRLISDEANTLRQGSDVVVPVSERASNDGRRLLPGKQERRNDEAAENNKHECRSGIDSFDCPDEFVEQNQQTYFTEYRLSSMLDSFAG